VSQAGILKVSASILPDDVPTSFLTDAGTAIPLANQIEVLGSGGATTSALGNVITVTVAASSSTTFSGNSGSATPAANNLNILGSIVAAGSSPISTSGAVDTLTINVQKAQATLLSNSSLAGLASFNSSHFSVNADGLVNLIGGGPNINQINVQTGTSPITPSSGSVTINGAVVSAGTNPVRTDGTGANTMAVEVQISQAIASADATKIGLCNFNSSQFSVDANGFVALSGGGLAIDSIKPNSGTNPVVPDVNGLVSILGTGSITAVGSLNTETIQLTGLTNHALQIGAGTATLTQLSPSATSGIPLVSQGAAFDPAYSTAVVAGGGTGNTTFTAYSVICAGTTATGAFQNVSGVGTATQVLTSNGAGTLPTWQAVAGGALDYKLVFMFGGM